ncbi:MAG: flotillin-like protein FloA [Clostridia bacterium]|nr:flotillin-like protein FloA [Clostridia bacterium]
MGLLLSITTYIWVGIAVVIILLLGFLFALLPFGLWFKALVSGAYIGIFQLTGMKLRKVNLNLLVDSYITAVKAGVKISIVDLETHYMAGGHVERVVDALITAHGAKINLTVENAKAIDLANRDILQAVQNCVVPIVITTPFISAVACDGIELKVKARVTVRYNIEKLIGNAGEDTIIARVGEGVVTAVGSAKSHKLVLENPDSISKTVLSKGLDKGTVYDILSIDIADIDVGRNIGAKLQAERAEADVQIATARAENRKAMAIATEHEMRAKTQEMKAKLLNAESDVPKAISMAFRAGNIGVMDYYRMQNVLSDTNMRNSVANSGGDNNNI